MCFSHTYDLIMSALMTLLALKCFEWSSLLYTLKHAGEHRNFSQ
uniref:Uncharacterized protein n=1 Tax=Anguilla anguilla TaxID=7936 RepID=A0A0E9PW49_ANGAN